eukprot:g2837.t1
MPRLRCGFVGSHKLPRSCGESSLRGGRRLHCLTLGRLPKVITRVSALFHFWVDPKQCSDPTTRSGMAASSNRQHPLSHWTCPKRSRTAFYEKATRHRRHRHRHAGVPCQELRRSLMCSLRKKGSKKQQRWLRFRAPSYQLHGRVEFNGGQLCGQSRGTLVAQDCNGPVNAIT